MGPVAQRLEPAAHNRLVGGSNPSGPTTHLAIRSSRRFLKAGICNADKAAIHAPMAHPLQRRRNRSVDLDDENGGDDRIRTYGALLGAQRFSKPPPSATRPRLRTASAYIGGRGKLQGRWPRPNAGPLNGLPEALTGPAGARPIAAPPWPPSSHPQPPQSQSRCGANSECHDHTAVQREQHHRRQHRQDQGRQAQRSELWHVQMRRPGTHQIDLGE